MANLKDLNVNNICCKLLYTIGFMDSLALSLYIPVLFEHMTFLGISPFMIGALNSTHAALQLISSPIIGSWSSIRGYRSVLQLLTGICAVSYLILGATTSVLLFVFIRIGLGMVEHTQMLCGTLLAKLAPFDKQVEVQGRLASFGGAGFVVGPAIGAVLTYSDNVYIVIMLIITLIYLVNLAIISFFLPNIQHTKSKLHEEASDSESEFSNNSNSNKTSSNKKNHPEPVSRLQSLYYEISRAITNLRTVNWTSYWDIFLFKFCFEFTCGLHYQSFFMFLKDVHGVTSAGINFVMFLMGLMGFVTGFSAESISKLYRNYESDAYRIFHSSVAFVFSFVFFCFGPNLTVVFGSLVVQSVASTFLRITMSEMIVQHAPADQVAALMGSGQSIVSLSFLLAPISSGLTYHLYSFQGTSTIQILAAVTTLACSLLLFRHKSKSLKIH